MLATHREPTPRLVITLDAGAAENAALVRVPVAVTGKWVRGRTTFEITRRHLEEITRNFRERQNGEINVDYDHASEMPEVAAGGPVPSAGRIVRLDPPEELRGSGLASRDSGAGSRYILWGWFEPTARARALVKNREYRYISPAIDWAARSKLSGKPQGTTLTSVALTNRPFLEELPQIRLSDPAFEPVQDNEIQGGNMKLATLSVADGKVRITHQDLTEEFFLDPEELKKCLEQLGFPPEPGAAPQALRGHEITLAEARAMMSENDARGKAVPAAEFFRAQVERELEDAIQAGRILPRQRDDWRRIALSDLPMFRRILAAMKSRVPLAPVGFSGSGPGDAQTQVKFLAEQRMRERGVTFGQALSEIGREQPDLVQQYRRAVAGGE